jgi:hypothetical protein
LPCGTTLISKTLYIGHPIIRNTKCGPPANQRNVSLIIVRALTVSVIDEGDCMMWLLEELE